MDSGYGMGWMWLFWLLLVLGVVVLVVVAVRVVGGGVTGRTADQQGRRCATGTQSRAATAGRALRARRDHHRGIPRAALGTG